MLTMRSSRHHTLGRAFAVGCVAAVVSVMFHGSAHALATWFGSCDYVLRHDGEGQPQAAYARLPGEGGSFLVLTCSRQVWDSDQPPVSFITAAVSQKQFLGRSDPRGRSTVYWFDDGGPEVGHWVYRDRHGQIRDPSHVNAFVDKLAGAQRLVVELSNYRYETRTSEFRLDAGDTRRVADRFRQDCRAILGDKPTDVSLRHKVDSSGS